LCLLCVYFLYTIMQWPTKSSKLAPVFTCVYYLCLPNVPLVFTALTQNRLVFTIWPPHSCTVLLCLCLLVFTTLFAERCVGVFAAYLGDRSQVWLQLHHTYLRSMQVCRTAWPHRFTSRGCKTACDQQRPGCQQYPDDLHRWSKWYLAPRQRSPALHVAIKQCTGLACYHGSFCQMRKQQLWQASEACLCSVMYLREEKSDCHSPKANVRVPCTGHDPLPGWTPQLSRQLANSRMTVAAET
jgi:hypothetical protein